MTQIIEALNWRYAVKKYDTSKKISESDLATLIEAISLSPSSMGLQPYKILNIVDPEMRLKLQEKSFGQSQVVDASNFIVFAAFTEMDEEYVDSYVAETASQRNSTVEDLKSYKDFLWGSASKIPTEKMPIWSSKQAYLALGNLLHSAASMKIDASPMEGFDPAGYDEVLGLKEKGLTAAVICALGYRHEDDKHQHAVKVRKTLKDLVETI
jgi:nitroreductase